MGCLVSKRWIDFCPEINTLLVNYCIFSIDVVPSCQKVQNLTYKVNLLCRKWSEIFNLFSIEQYYHRSPFLKHSSIPISLFQSKQTKLVQDIWRSCKGEKNCNVLFMKRKRKSFMEYYSKLCLSTYQQNTTISFEYVDFRPKIYLN